MTHLTYLTLFDICGCSLFNITVTSKIAANDSDLWSCVYYYQFYNITNFWVCMISRLLILMIFPSVVYFPVCAISCNLDSQITSSTEDI